MSPSTARAFGWVEQGLVPDRVVSVEMFEHLRNWPHIFARVAGWLKAEGR